MEFEIRRLVDGAGEVSDGSIVWDLSGSWNFHTDSPQVAEALRQVDEAAGVWKIAPAHGEGIIGDGKEFVPVAHAEFIEHLGEHLKAYGVLELREQVERNVSRWTDNPFRDPNATPEQIEWLEKRDRAFSHWRKTGDRQPLVDLGLFNPEPPGETQPAKDD